MADKPGSFIGLASLHDNTFFSPMSAIFIRLFPSLPALSKSTIYDFYAFLSFCPIASFYCPLILVCPFSLIPC